MLARHELPYLLGAVALAALTFAVALRLRSWPLWLLAFLLTLAALSLAWVLRDGMPVLLDLPAA